MRAALSLAVLVLLLGPARRAGAQDAAPVPEDAAPVPEDAALDLERGVALFRAGDYRGAIPHLERAHAASPDSVDTTLLLAIACTRDGRDAEALPLLEEAARARDPEIAGSARLFLGLIAERRGDEEEARRRFDEVAASGSGDLAAAARVLATRSTPLSAYALVQAEVDSNVPLYPQTVAGVGDPAAGDLAVLGLLSVEGCLGGADRACLGGLVLGRKLARLVAHDLVALSGALHYRHDGARTRLALGYRFEPSWRGGQTFARAHVGDATLRRQLGSGYALDVALRVAHRTYLQEDYAALTGAAVDGLAGVRRRSGRLRWAVAATGLREWADVEALAAAGGGARAELRLGPFGPVSVELQASAVGRRFDSGRRDLQLGGEARVVIAALGPTAVIAGATALANLSSDPDGELTKLTAYLGADVAFAGP